LRGRRAVYDTVGEFNVKSLTDSLIVISCGDGWQTGRLTHSFIGLEKVNSTIITTSLWSTDFTDQLDTYRPTVQPKATTP